MHLITAGPNGIQRLPHPVPYQGSKRLLALRILQTVGHRRFTRLVEPFSGSAAVSLAAAYRGVADSFWINDSLEPLASLWNEILRRPERLANRYEEIWRSQLIEPHHYEVVRDEFNRDREPAKLHYLLARCVKNAPRFNGYGYFNQSPDRRRRGMQPTKMRREILGAHALLGTRARTSSLDFEQVLAETSSSDLVYMDPPYEGTTVGRDKRYVQQVARARLERSLASLVERRVPFLLSYDGSTGGRSYGPPLPERLGLLRLGLVAGPSSQATLNGRRELTIESLYVSPAIAPIVVDQLAIPLTSDQIAAV